MKAKAGIALAFLVVPLSACGQALKVQSGTSPSQTFAVSQAGTYNYALNLESTAQSPKPCATLPDAPSACVSITAYDCPTAVLRLRSDTGVTDYINGTGGSIDLEAGRWRGDAGSQVTSTQFAIAGCSWTLTLTQH